MRATIPCPHCQSATRIRSNRPVNSTARELSMFCTNIECGATYRAAITLLNQVSPSAVPKPGVPLAMAPPRRRVANDDPAHGPEVLRPSNDDEELSEASG